MLALADISLNGVFHHIGMDSVFQLADNAALADIARLAYWAERELPSACTQWWSAPSQQAFAQSLWQLQLRIQAIEELARSAHWRMGAIG